jgi:hypothetical protein
VVKRKTVSYKDSTEYRAWKTIVTGSETFPTERFFEEISQDHKARKSRRLSFGKSSALMSDYLKEQEKMVWMLTAYTYK